MKTMATRPSGVLTRSGVEQILRQGFPLREQDAARLYRLYIGQLTKYAAKAGAADPEAAANSALFDVFRAHTRNPILDEAAFRTYAFRAAKNHTINEGRRRRPEPIAPETIVATEEPRSQQIVDNMWLKDILGQLPEDQADVLRMRLVEGLSAEEAGRHLGRGPNAIYQLQHRAEITLRRVAFAALIVMVAVAGAVVLMTRQTTVVIEPSPADESEDQTITVPSSVVERQIEDQDGSREQDTIRVELGPEVVRPQTDTSLDGVESQEPPATETPVSTTVLLSADSLSDEPAAEAAVEPAPEANTESDADAQSETLTEPETKAEPETVEPETPPVEEPTSESNAPVEAPIEAPAYELVALSATPFNTCTVLQNGVTTWIELFDISLASGSKPAAFAEPYSVVVSFVDTTGRTYEIDSTISIKQFGRSGWSEAGEPGFADSPESGESRWSISIATPSAEVVAVRYRETSDSEFVQVADCPEVG